MLAKSDEVASMWVPEEAAEQLIMRATDDLNFFNNSKMDLSKLGESGIQANLISYIQLLVRRIHRAARRCQSFVPSSAANRLDGNRGLYFLYYKVRSTILFCQRYLL